MVKSSNGKIISVAKLVGIISGGNHTDMSKFKPGGNS